MDQERVETLHQQASDNFLKGDYEAAKAAWSELLELNPEDERAQEGSRMCLHMSQSEGSEEDEPSMASESIELPLPLDPDEEADVPEASEQAETEPASDEMSAGEIDLNLEVLDGLAESVEKTSQLERDEHEASAGPETAGEPGSIDIGLDMNLLDDLNGVKSEVDDNDAGQSDEGMGDLLMDVDTDLPSHEASESSSGEPGSEPAEQQIGLEPCETNLADQELKRRIDDLLQEAAAADDDGNTENALEILSRLFILDENHEGGKVLEETIRERLGENISQMAEENVGETEVLPAVEPAEEPVEDSGENLDEMIRKGVQLLEAGDLETSKNVFNKVLDKSPDHKEARHFLEQAEEMIALMAEEDGDLATGDGGSDAVLDAFQDHGAIDLDDADSGSGSIPIGEIPAADSPVGDPTAGALEEALEAPEPVASEKSARVAGKGMNRKLPAVAAVVLIVLAGSAYLYFGTDLLGGGGAKVADGATTAAGSPESHVGDRMAGQDTERSTEDLLAEADRLSGVLSNAPSRDSSEKIRQALQMAQAAMEEGRYGEAVISYNDVLAVDPANQAANTGLTKAGREYRARKAEYEELERAKQSFISGDFTSALKVLYRLPRDLAPESVELYNVNSWYNMGIVALKAGDTVKAIDHLNDALRLHPDDKGALNVKGIAEEFHGVIKDISYYSRVERLTFRTLDE